MPGVIQTLAHAWSPGNLIVRATYLATAVCASVLALPIAASNLSDAFTAPSKGWAALGFTSSQ